MASDVSDQLRSEVAQRAFYRCEYCLIHEEDSGFAHQVDHIFSRKHGGKTKSDNLAYACVPCNRYKGTDLTSIDPVTGEVVRLFHPREDRWTGHFRLVAGVIQPLTEKARATVRLLRFNAPERLAERSPQ